MALAFPFSAIVGQEEMKRAILIAAVDPSVGGVLVLGDRGTGKSTAVRALAALLPPMRATVGCRYGCDPAAAPGACDDCATLKAGRRPKSTQVPVPVVDLPLGATEDRVVGALDLERALTAGEKVFEPGLLARAHRGFLYVDEVNLLEDHLVDLLIDVAERFRHAGWQVWSDPCATEADLVALVRSEWFDVIGLSVGGDVLVAPARSVILAMRAASRNPAATLMLGGPLASLRSGLADEVGADFSASDVGTALERIESLSAMRASPS